VKDYYGDHIWDDNKWKLDVLDGSKAQKFLKKMLSKIFSGMEDSIEYNHRTEILKIFGGIPSSLDIWIPKYNLALEFQGKQHYIPSSFYGSFRKQLERDIAKKKACIESGICLIYIPFWWDHSEYSLAATIHQVCYMSIEIFNFFSLALSRGSYGSRRF
jgi:hypothetical protein